MYCLVYSSNCTPAQLPLNSKLYSPFKVLLCHTLWERERWLSWVKSCSPKGYVRVWYLWTWPYLEIVFADVSKFKWACIGVGSAIIQWLVPVGEEESVDSDIRGGHHVTMEAQIGITLLVAKEHWELLPVTKRQERGSNQIFLLSPQEGTDPADILISEFRPPGQWKNTFWLF